MNTNTELIPRTTITEIVAHRDSAIAKIRQAANLLRDGHELAKEAQDSAQNAHGAATFTLSDRSKSNAYARLFLRFDADESVEVYRQQIDARVWMHLVSLTGMEHMMDRTARDKMREDLCGTVPEVTEKNVRDVFASLAADAGLIFQRGLARAFSDLDRRFKSHDAFKLGSRVILTNVFDGNGSWNYHGRMKETLADIERVFAVFDGKAPDPAALAKAINEDRGSGFYARQSLTETPYFRVRVFMNGNCHLWFTRDDLVAKANSTLADYYGEVLPDGVPEDAPESDLRSRSGALSRDLAFYPTPEKVTRFAIQNVYINEASVILEPSAGTGNIAKVLLEHGAKVTAVEVAQDRYETLCGRPDNTGRLRVLQANFLRMVPSATYTHVVMNPPFYGTHWIEHVIHAFDFLAEHGTLIAILPVSAELGQSRKHERFRKWARKRAGYGSMFRDLPDESFAESGTRVSTVVLTLHRNYIEE